MRIAILGWGSLIYDPGNLTFIGEWFSDGPMLPIEYARISGIQKGLRYLSLVIKPGFPEVQTLYTESTYSTLEEAVKNLSEREECPEGSIGYINFQTTNCLIRREGERIKSNFKLWNETKDYDAVIWTDLGPNFSDQTGLPYTAQNLLVYLSRLNANEFKKSKEYILKTPRQVQTRFRPRIEDFLLNNNFEEGSKNKL